MENNLEPLTEERVLEILGGVSIEEHIYYKSAELFIEYQSSLHSMRMFIEEGDIEGAMVQQEDAADLLRGHILFFMSTMYIKHCHMDDAELVICEE
ncbi:MAG: hypothetical protein AABY15_06995 [Nanoarchaeota archaeon]